MFPSLSSSNSRVNLIVASIAHDPSRWLWDSIASSKSVAPAYWQATFDNPPLNLFDPEVAYELRELINQMETSKELKVIVFDSADPDFYIGHVAQLQLRRSES